ncbi:MAG: T9SS type A sorting domain-containing protein [Ignavibacteria bacterium]|nr:T9SS type A sorting domain-containing protein [Ignavibacteria bacterium]
MNVDDGKIFDFSDEDFTLTSEIIVVSPNGAEVWQAGTSKTITWIDNLEGEVKIELYKSGVFNSEIVNSTPTNGSYTWDLSNNLQSAADYKIKISSINNSQITDFSDSNFTVVGKFITVTSPNNSKIWQAGTTHEILWLDNISENVRIELYKDEVFDTEINPSTTSNGSILWNIPFLIEGGSNYKIKITSTNDPGTYDFSASSFTIVGNQINVTSPNGGESWLIGSLHEIIWTDQLDGDVQILLYRGGILHTIVATSTSSDGSITWNVPSIEEGNDYKIKIVSVITDEVFDESDSNFTFTNFIDVTDQFNGIPLNYELLQNYPNPFNPTTTIYYALPKESSVELKIYDILGNEIMTFNEKEQSAGYHKIEFDAARYNSGVYIYRLQAGIFVETKKMILLR